MENLPATLGADEEMCKVHSRNWTRIEDSDKEKILCNQLTDQSRYNILKKLVELNPPILSSLLSSSSSSSKGSSHDSSRKYNITRTAAVFNTVRSLSFSSASNTDVNFLKAMQNDLTASLWDFAGQEVFHNTHSVFISDSGVSVVTFNAFELTKTIVCDDRGTLQPAKSCTIISSIHYWLQVINSVCSVKENVLLVGTHIDKLHSKPKKARKIASSKILHVLEKELFNTPYAKHIAYHSEDLKIALKKSCFFVSNKYRDEEVEKLKDAAVGVATSLRAKEKPLLMYLKIERVLLHLNEKVISVSTMHNLVVENTFPLDKNSPEFTNTLRYFHNNRTILHFDQIESLKDLVILSPKWLAKLFSYVIVAQSYKQNFEFDSTYKRLTEYGILHECLLQHMLNKFYLDYPVADKVQLTKKQTVDILLDFHLIVRITSKARFAEEGFPRPPKSGDIFIVPSLVCTDDRTPTKTSTEQETEQETERIIYFTFRSSFIPISLLNQLIAKCIYRSMERDDTLLW